VHQRLPCHLRVADAVAVEVLVIVHRHRHSQQLAGEFAWRIKV